MRSALFGTLLLLALSGVGLAYVPSAGWIFTQMAERRANLKLQNLRVQLECSGGAETLGLRAGKSRRDTESGLTELCVDHSCVQTKAGDRASLPDWTYLKYFFFTEPPSPDFYAKLIHALGIDAKVNTYTRAGNRVAYVLGAKEWELHRPQIWIDKERFLPLRLILLSDKRLIDIRWFEWGGKSSGDWFPGKIEVRQDDQVLESCTTLEVDSAAAIDDSAFR